MEDNMTDETTPETIALAASAPTKFSLIQRLRDRDMPTEDVSIFINDAAEWERQSLLEESMELVVRGEGEERAALQQRRDWIDGRIAELEEEVRASEVIFSLRAISNERYDELLDEAAKSFPIKYEKITNPLTGRVTMETIASPDREELFNNIFMADCVTQVRMGNEIDDEITPEWIEQFQRYAPLDALRVVTTQAYKMRMAGEWMDHYQNEDFSPKP